MLEAIDNIPSPLTSKLQPPSSNLYDQVGYFLSPFDFLKERFTFFLFKAAFKRLSFFRLLMHPSVFESERYNSTLQFHKNYIKREVGVLKNLYSGTFKHFVTQFSSI